jgi:DNA-binding MarR family transcriptional regulator
LTRPEHGQAPDAQRDALVWAAVTRLNQVGNAVSRGRLAERAAAAAGLSLDRPAMSVLLALHTAAKPLRIGEIAEIMQVVGPHVTRQVQELERRGLVHRIADPHDKRASLIEPTPEGTAATDRYSASMIDWFADVVGEWPEHERYELGRLLGKLADDAIERLARLDDDPPPAAGPGG